MKNIISILLLMLTFYQNGWTKDYRHWDLPEGTTMRLGKGKVNDLAFSPNGKHFIVTGSMGIWVYDARTYEHIALLTADFKNRSHISMDTIKFAQNGDTFFTLSRSHSSDGDLIRIWDAYTGRTKTQFRVGQNSYIFVLSPNGKTLAHLNRANRIQLWDTQTGEHKTTFDVKDHSKITFTPDGKQLVIANTKKTSIQFWDLDTRLITKTIQADEKHQVNWLAFISNTILATGKLNESVRFWSLSTDEHTDITLYGNIEYRGIAAFSPTTKWLASVTADGNVQLWSLVTGKSETIFTNNGSNISSIAFSADGLSIARASTDGNIYIVDVKTQKQLAKITGHTASITTPLTFIDEGQMLASGGYIWNLKTGQPKTIFIPDVAYNFYRAFNTFSPDGKFLATTSSKCIFLSYANTGVTRTMLSGESDNPPCVAFSPDGTTLAIGGWIKSRNSGRHYGNIRLWNVITGEQRSTLTDHTNRVTCIAFSPDGKVLASGSNDQTICLWNPDTGELSNTLTGHNSSINRLVFSPDGKTLVSVADSRDNSIWLWDPLTGKQKAKLIGHTWGVNTVVFSPDGKYLASASRDNTIRLWNIETKKQLRVYELDHKNITSIVFSPDAKNLVSSNSDGTILFWNTSDQ